MDDMWSHNESLESKWLPKCWEQKQQGIKWHQAEQRYTGYQLYKVVQDDPLAINQFQMD
jgi:hypothetical protein